MGTVARAEPTAKVTSLADGHATQMCADTCWKKLMLAYHPMFGRTHRPNPNLSIHRPGLFFINKKKEN